MVGQAVHKPGGVGCVSAHGPPERACTPGRPGCCLVVQQQVPDQFLTCVCEESERLQKPQNPPDSRPLLYLSLMPDCALILGLLEVMRPCA